MRENIIVYLGASLGRARASFLLPNARYCPPLQANDFKKLLDLPDVMIILDGVYSPCLEKQVADLLASGVKIYGAASLGALLAAKLRAQGMIGMGATYQHFVRRPQENHHILNCRFIAKKNSYQRQTEPLINIYATMEHAVSGNALSSSMAKIITESSESLLDNERSFENIFKQAEQAGIDKNVLIAFSDWINNGGYVDQLRSDACLLLNRIAYDTQKTIDLFHPKMCDQGLVVS